MVELEERQRKLLAKMILMLLCAGGDDSGIGVSASDSTVFDGVGDTCVC